MKQMWNKIINGSLNDRADCIINNNNTNNNNNKSVRNRRKKLLEML